MQEGDGTWRAVNNLVEQQQILAARAEEEQRAEQIQQQMDRQPIVQPDQERQRPNQQLELDEARSQSSRQGLPISRLQNRREAARKRNTGQGDGDRDM